MFTDEQAICSGDLYPFVQYRIFYIIPKEQRLKRAQLIVTLGKPASLHFNCDIMEEMREYLCIFMIHVGMHKYVCIPIARLTKVMRVGTVTVHHLVCVGFEMYG